MVDYSFRSPMFAVAGFNSDYWCRYMSCNNNILLSTNVGSCIIETVLVTVMLSIPLIMSACLWVAYTGTPLDTL